MSATHGGRSCPDSRVQCFRLTPPATDPVPVALYGVSSGGRDPLAGARASDAHRDLRGRRGGPTRRVPPISSRIVTMNRSTYAACSMPGARVVWPVPLATTRSSLECAAVILSDRAIREALASGRILVDPL